MYDKPVVLGTVGRGFPVFRQPAHVVQTLTPSEAPLYTHQEVLSSTTSTRGGPGLIKC